MKKIFLQGPYLPKHHENLMAQEGSVESARENFLRDRFRNLDYLLHSRYNWMNEYLTNPNAVSIELGAGAGLSHSYLKYKPLLSDAVLNPWIEQVIDATKMDNLVSDSVDVLIASHNIHHFYSPYKFFKECERVLKINGVLLIQEINTSLLMRGLLRLMRHEGWSYKVDVFDEYEIVNDPADLWSANCATPELLFENEKKFMETFPTLVIQRNDLCECLIFPMSGGVISKTKVPQLPHFVLKMILFIDALLIRLSPNTFALGRRVVISKNG
jgi:SAM-dependent methyltransferase